MHAGKISVHAERMPATGAEIHGGKNYRINYSSLNYGLNRITGASVTWIQNWPVIVFYSKWQKLSNNS